MPAITFQPVLRDLKEILKSDFYSIPRFQRPYSWNSENLEDFWRDVVLDNTEGYFIGPMVCYHAGSDVYNIVDGQQRTTSITLALCLLRDLFQSLEAVKLADGLQKYIERDDDDSVPHFVLRSEAAGHYLKSQIQNRIRGAAVDPKNDEERALKKARDDISRWLRDQIDGLDVSHPDGPESSPAAVRLREIRDRILSLQVIWIVLDSEDDAYVIFETLNSRGKDLEVVDLLKNLLFGYIKAENGDLDMARVHWSEMRETLSLGGNGANPNKFILHWWLSQNDYTAERKLFRLIKASVSKPSAPDILSSLRNDSLLYAHIANPDEWDCKNFERPAKASLTALNLFGVRQPRPFLLALLRAYESDRIKIAKVKAAVRAIEVYHFMATAVVGVSSTGGVSMMYASHAREISAAKNSAEIHSSIDALIQKLKKRMPNKETFVSEFANAIRYSSERPEARRLVQYTLAALHDYSMPGVALDHAKCNIEHISPQSDPHEWTAEAGNLLWIDADLNQHLGAKKFHVKQSILAEKQGTYFVQDILDAKSWDEGEVRARSVRLADLAYDKVWKIS